MVLQRAMSYARWAHEGQFRKYTGSAYIVHPLAVMGLVFSVLGNEEEVLAAAVLHDTVEDTDTTFEDIKKGFGAEVAHLVFEVTDVSTKQDGNRAARKAKDRIHLSKASPFGQTIKLADLIDNTQTIALYDEDFAVVYMKEKRALLDVLVDGHPELLRVAEWQVENYFNMRAVK